MPSTIYSVKSIGFTQPALLFFKPGLQCQFCVSLCKLCCQKKKKRLKKGNKKKDNHKTKYYKTNFQYLKAK